MHAYTYSQHTDTLKLPRGESLLLCIKKKLAPLFEQPSLLWSDPVGARRRRAKALRRRAPPHVPISIQTTERGVHSIQTMPPLALSIHVFAILNQILCESLLCIIHGCSDCVEPAAEYLLENKFLERRQIQCHFCRTACLVHQGSHNSQGRRVGVFREKITHSRGILFVTQWGCLRATTSFATCLRACSQRTIEA